jgi:hypothetical protein
MPIVHALLAAGADLDATDENGSSARQELARFGRRIDPAEIKVARRDIAKARIDFVRNRALQVCIGLECSNSTRFKCAKSCSTRVATSRISFRFTSGGRLRPR